MEEERKKHTHEIILEPIQVIKEQKEEVSEKAIEKKSEMVGLVKSSVKNSPQKGRLEQNKGNLKSALLNRGKIGASEKLREEVKLPKVANKSPYHEHRR
jgi:hypothetical protein